MNIHDYLFGGLTRQTVYKSLDAGALRGRVIAENIANVTTPGYRRKEVTFEDELKKVFEKKIPGETTQPGHAEIARGEDISKIQPKVMEPIDPTLPGEVNNVDVDMEMSKLAENQILYNFSIHFTSFENSQMQNAISGKSS
jgi:flagellar basal-body rod protein FlgB